MNEDLPSPIPTPPNDGAPAPQSAVEVVEKLGTSPDPYSGHVVASTVPRRGLGRVLAALGLIVAAAASLMVGLSNPAEPKIVDVKSPAATVSLDSLISAAMSDNASNDANADSAPKQQVVNGWVARDLLHIIGLQNDASAKSLDAVTAAIIDSRPVPVPLDQRPTRLLMILVLALCWVGCWMIIPNRTLKHQAARA